MVENDFDIHVSYKSVRYSEGDLSLSFDREPSFGSLPAIIWIPSPERWAVSTPPWARDRRDEIVARLRVGTPASDTFSNCD
jgi:hypothetical protein